MRLELLGPSLSLLLVSSCASSPPSTANAPAWGTAPEAAAVPATALHGPASAPREGGKRSGEHKHHHLAVAVGAVAQSGEDSGDGARIALEYEHMWPEGKGFLGPKWGLGAMIENNTPPVDSVLIAAQLAYHPVPQARLVIAPGVSLEKESSSSPVLRFGIAWEFELGEHASIAPELFYDFLDGGERTAVLAVALGYGW